MGDRHDGLRSILAWHEAVNDGNVELALHVSTPDIVVGGPKGEASGHVVLAEWIRHADIRLEPIAVHQLDSSVIVEEDATWPRNEATSTAATPIRVASVFTVRNDLVASIHRFDSLEVATAFVHANEHLIARQPPCGTDGYR